MTRITFATLKLPPLKTLILLLLSLFILNSVAAQDYLVLQKTGSTRKKLFTIGDNIRFITKKGTEVSGAIKVIGDSSMTVTDSVYSYSDIIKFHKGKTFGFRTLLGVDLVGAALIIPGVQVVNKILFGSAGPWVEKSGLIIMGVGITAGSLVLLSIRPWYQLNKGDWKLKRLD